MSDTESERKRAEPIDAPFYDYAFDVIVVGAGLAGSAAAITMAREGLDVIMIERGAYPGAKNVFGGVLYTPTIRDLVDIDSAPTERHIEEKRFAMLTDDDELAASITLGEWREPPHNDSYTVYRGRFDRWFAEQAEDAGATLITETTVTGLLREDGQVVGVETDRPDGALRAPVVVLAEGGNSLVAESADLKDSADREHVAVAVKEVLEFPDADNAIEQRFRLNDKAGSAYHYFGSGAVGDAFGGAFIYTNSSTVSVGLAYRIGDAVERQPDPEATLNAFKSHPAVAPLVAGGRTVEYGAKTIPEGGASAVPKLVHDGAVLVGDAAGLVLNNGIHLEGTNMAVESGYLAGQAIAKAFENARDTIRPVDAAPVATRADGGVTITEAELQGYPDAMNSSFVLENLDHYEWLINTVVADRELCFEQLPDSLARAAAEYFRMDRTPKTVHGQRAKDELLATLGGWRGAIRLAWRYRHLVR